MEPESVPAVAEKSGLTAKELAIYVGVPVATLCVAGGLYYLYTKKSTEPDEKVPKLKDATDGAPVAIVTPQVSTGEDTGTPMEIAMAAKGKGNKYFKAGRFEQAIECYSKALEYCPKESVAEISTYYQNRAAANEQLKNWQQVVDDCTEAIKLNSKYIKALARRARAYETLNRKRSCLEDITATCILEGFSNQSSLILADGVLRSLGKELAEEYFKTRPRILPSPVFIKSYLDSFNKNVFIVNIPEAEQEESLYFKILTAIAHNEYEDLIELCTQEIEQDGANKLHALLLRGTLHTLKSSIEEAMADFDLVMAAEDNDITKKTGRTEMSVFKHGHVLTKYCKDDGSARSLAQTSLNPSSLQDLLKVDALIKRGSLKMQQGKDKECYADFELAEELDPENPNIFHHRGQLYFLTERLAEGKKEFEKCIELDPNFPAPRIQLSYCVCKIGMQMMQPSLLKEANAILEETTERFPDCAEAWSLFGQLLQDQQDLDAASEKLEKAISLAPHIPTTYVYKALLMLQWKSDIEAATALLRQAVELDDKCDFAYETLATLEVQKGNSEEAVKLFEKALDLVRTEPEMASTFSLLEAAKAQTKVANELGIKVPNSQMI